MGEQESARREKFKEAMFDIWVLGLMKAFAERIRPELVPDIFELIKQMATELDKAEPDFNKTGGLNIAARLLAKENGFPELPDINSCRRC